jgi:hypothetical protein
VFVIRKLCPVVFLLAACCLVQARPLTIIIVTSKDSAETRYAAFLQEIYLDNADVLVDDNRYQEPLTEIEKQELLDADLVIISSDNSGGDYNDDSAFWATLPVPILSHSISICRTNLQANWDWFAGDQTTVPIAAYEPIEPDDPLFDGIDLTGGTIPFFDPPLDVAVSDAPYAGYGTAMAVEGTGLPVIVRYDGGEPAYYDGSLYAPGGAPRIFLALPDEPETFFVHAAPAAKQLLRNAVTALLAECWLPGDIDCDRDVDLQDFAALSGEWLDPIPPLSADIVPDSQVNLDDFALLALYWLEGFDTTPPSPDPFDWTTPPAIQDGGFIQMKAKTAEDTLHGVQYYFECLETGLYSSGWQYDRQYTPAGLPIGTDLSFRAKARDTSSRFNETHFSSIQTARTDGLFYYAADASAAVALDDHRFMMADDEFNILQVYDWNAPASDPIAQTDISTEIGAETEHPEADIEGATWYNGRIFWITSHGRSREGDYWPSRYRFFATAVAPDGTAVVEGVYANLIDDLIQYDRVHNIGIEAAIGTVDGHINPATIADLAPKVNGLNIEGLCTTADGSKMLIGFRNPRPVIDGKAMALVIPLANPEAVVQGAAPILEPPVFIDFNGLGIRSMEYSPTFGEYLIVAGSHLGGENEPVQYLYNYDFAAADKDKLATFSDLTPEAIFQFPLSSDIHLLSDDGTLMIDTPVGPVMNKLLPRPQRSFRTRTIKP